MGGDEGFPTAPLPLSAEAGAGAARPCGERRSGIKATRPNAGSGGANPFPRSGDRAAIHHGSPADRTGGRDINYANGDIAHDAICRRTLCQPEGC